ncbi:alpha/beta fold hydrolase [Streptomyces sp. ACA25]|uniref:alpha/beta hydrolase n=1 Tax=Streptomyces sp. ACA25 TaxID=3022596 RepID=UPI002308116F|nr:alpha/beta fold hydrolase [Streptomyces sp. ACA25]MDB1088436.1 alpha/beta fold hydrolase [Streptomyces sp. ACA25]
MRRRTSAALAATALLGAGAAAVAAGRIAGGAALRTHPERGEPAGFHGPELTVHSVESDRIALTRTLATLRPGRYGISGRTCRAVVGPVLDEPGEADTVVRRLERISHGDLTAGTRVKLTPQLYEGDPHSALGITCADVDIPGADGKLPAWFVPGHRDTWIVTLHGLGSGREHPLNVLPFLQQHRFPVLLPAYRGDLGAPPLPDGLSRLGTQEWRDADAAVHYAVRFGARRVLLYGWSVGAAMALHTAARSALRDRIAGIVLDSPVLDPAATLRALAADRGVPRPLLPLAVAAARARIALDHATPPDADTRPDGAPRPMLLVHGPADSVAPWDVSRRFADRHPANVTLHSVANAGHAAMWNAGPSSYEEALRRFLTPLI